jgi:type IV pilus assembly protein PilM
MDILGFFKNRACTVGIDMGDDALKMVCVSSNGNGVRLVAGGSKTRPENIKAGSVSWQRWAIEAIKKLAESTKLRNRQVMVAIPASEVFIDHLKMPKGSNGDRMEDLIFSKVKHKLPFEASDAMLKYIPTEDDNVMVIATDREKIDRHLAIYEQANLAVKAIAVWPAALVSSYVNFFGRRKSDEEAVVMLLNIEPNYSNVVMCRYRNLLFARTIPIGSKQLVGDEPLKRLVMELSACRRQFTSIYKRMEPERLIFLSGQTVDRDICAQIAKLCEMPAQVGDCLAAVELDGCRNGVEIDRRRCQVNWATALGLSLS